MPPLLLDTNVLIHASNRSSAFQPMAGSLVERGLGQKGIYCIAPQNLVEFGAVVSRPRLVEEPMPPAEIARITKKLYQSRRLGKIYPRRATVMRTMQEGVALAVIGPRWYDLFLAVTMRDAGISTIVTENLSDFRSFPFIRVLSIREAFELQEQA